MTVSRLALFGATGRVGSELLTQALAAGHDVRVLVRSPAKLAATSDRFTMPLETMLKRRRGRTRADGVSARPNRQR